MNEMAMYRLNGGRQPVLRRSEIANLSPISMVSFMGERPNHSNIKLSGEQEKSSYSKNS